MQPTIISDAALRDEDHPETRALVSRLQQAPNAFVVVLVTMDNDKDKVFGQYELVRATSLLSGGTFEMSLITDDQHIPSNALGIGHPSGFPLFVVTDTTPIPNRNEKLLTSEVKNVLVSVARTSLSAAYVDCTTKVREYRDVLHSDETTE
jgi:hypothetical protein